MGRELVTTPSRLFRGKEMMSPSRLFRRPSMPKCPVAALQEGHQRILVAVKMTEQSGELIRWALTEAARTGDTLTVMHVTEPWAAAQTSAGSLPAPTTTLARRSSPDSIALDSAASPTVGPSEAFRVSSQFLYSMRVPRQESPCASILKPSFGTQLAGPCTQFACRVRGVSFRSH